MIVTVYTQPSCGGCIATKRALTSAGIEYEEKDLRDPVNLEAAKSLGLKSAPVVAAGDQVWCGFRPDLISALKA